MKAQSKNKPKLIQILGNKVLVVDEDTIQEKTRVEEDGTEEIYYQYEVEKIKLQEYNQKQFEQKNIIANTKLTQEQEKALAYLNSTDWVVAKIGELQIQGKDTSELITKYADVLAKREECRQLM